MADHERFQMFCRVCFKVFEADTLIEAYQKVSEHEIEMTDLVAQGKRHPRTHEEIKEKS
jgi:hypothetical protein